MEAKTHGSEPQTNSPISPPSEGWLLARAFHVLALFPLSSCWLLLFTATRSSSNKPLQRLLFFLFIWLSVSCVRQLLLMVHQMKTGDVCKSSQTEGANTLQFTSSLVSESTWLKNQSINPATTWCKAKHREAQSFSTDVHFFFVQLAGGSLLSADSAHITFLCFLAHMISYPGPKRQSSASPMVTPMLTSSVGLQQNNSTEIVCCISAHEESQGDVSFVSPSGAVGPSLT